MKQVIVPDYLTAPQAAKFLKIPYCRFRLTPFPYTVMGKNKYYDKADLLQWLKENKRIPIAQAIKKQRLTSAWIKERRDQIVADLKFKNKKVLPPLISKTEAREMIKHHD